MGTDIKDVEHMITENGPKLDPITAQLLKNELQQEQARKAEAARKFTPPVRIRRPWLGEISWKRHKAKRSKKRRAAKKAARQTIRAQRRA